MFQFFINTTLRNLFRQKVYSLINILGLSIGMAAFILILLWVEDEFSFEKNHKNAECIFLTFKGYSIGGKTDYNSSLPFPLGPYVMDNFQEANKVVRVLHAGCTISYENKVFHERNFIFADSCYFDVFTYNILKGNPGSFFKEGHGVVITASIAEKYFGDSDPVGKILTRDQSQQFVVTGIVEDPPGNTHMNANIIANMVAYPEANKYIDSWAEQFISTYIFMQNPGQQKELEDKMTMVMQKNLETEQTTVRLQPIKKLHLYSISGQNHGKQYVITFLLIGIFIILIACINFMNLTTARYSNRSREIGLKKVVGVTRWQLVGQFLGESILMTLIAAFLAMMLAEIVRPYFNDITGKALNFNYLDIKLFVRLFGLVLLVGLLSGSYPAFILSKFQPSEILRKNIHTGEKGALFRKVLVVFQFAISTILIFSVVIIYRQIFFITDKDQGYQTEDILYFPIEGKIGDNYESFRNELLACPYIEDAGRSSQLPCDISWIMRGIELEGREHEGGVSFGVSSVDGDYFRTIKLPLLEGRAFAKDLKSDTNSLIFNEEAIKLIGKQNMVGGSLKFYDDQPDVKVIGMVPDFHSQPLTNEIEPLVFVVWEDNYNYVLVRAARGMANKAREHIEHLWKSYAPGFPYHCEYLEHYINWLYNDEKRISKLAGISTILALLISALGLIGLTAFIIEQRYKEIGLRKVFGSSIYQIQYLLSSKYIRWVILATVIAIPVAWYWMAGWLNSFAYRIEIRFLDFLVTALVTILIALIITFLQVLRASYMKPVDVLKYE